MSFDDVLQELVQRTRADLAVFCDYEGEAISLFTESVDPFDVKITGAQLGALLFRLQEVARESGQSERVAVQCCTDQRTVLVETLPGGYYVVLGIPQGRLWAEARALLREVANRFASEL